MSTRDGPSARARIYAVKARAARRMRRRRIGWVGLGLEGKGDEAVGDIFESFGQRVAVVVLKVKSAEANEDGLFLRAEGFDFGLDIHWERWVGKEKVREVLSFVNILYFRRQQCRELDDMRRL
jgi:hypothetical protein